MTFALLILCHFLHIASTVIWLGGISIILLVVLPAAKSSLHGVNMTGPMMKEVARRFTPLANTSILMMLGSGGIIWYFGNSHITPHISKFFW